MKIAITGHTKGIGKKLSEIYSSKGHEIVGLSRSNGYEIKDVDKLLPLIEPCDIFINNAYDKFYQVELLFGMYKLWYTKPNKKIINISTFYTSYPSAADIGIEWIEYHVHKTALEDAVEKLRMYYNWPALTVVKPGLLSNANIMGADVDKWCEHLVEMLNLNSEMLVEEITLGMDFLSKGQPNNVWNLQTQYPVKGRI